MARSDEDKLEMNSPRFDMESLRPAVTGSASRRHLARTFNVTVDYVAGLQANRTYNHLSKRTTTQLYELDGSGKQTRKLSVIEEGKKASRRIDFAEDGSRRITLSDSERFHQYVRDANGNTLLLEHREKDYKYNVKYKDPKSPSIDQCQITAKYGRSEIAININGEECHGSLTKKGKVYDFTLPFSELPRDRKGRLNISRKFAQLNAAGAVRDDIRSVKKQPWKNAGIAGLSKMAQEARVPFLAVSHKQPTLHVVPRSNSAQQIGPHVPSFSSNYSLKTRTSPPGPINTLLAQSSNSSATAIAEPDRPARGGENKNNAAAEKALGDQMAAFALGSHAMQPKSNQVHTQSDGTKLADNPKPKLSSFEAHPALLSAPLTPPPAKNMPRQSTDSIRRKDLIDSAASSRSI